MNTTGAIFKGESEPVDWSAITTRTCMWPTGAPTGVMLRLPRDLLDREVVENYCAADQARAWGTVDDSIVLDFTSDDEGRWSEFDYDAEALLSALVGVRAELAAGDRRPLYLAWLAAYGAWERDENVFDRDRRRRSRTTRSARIGCAQCGGSGALPTFCASMTTCWQIAAQASPPLDEDRRR